MLRTAQQPGLTLAACAPMEWSQRRNVMGVAVAALVMFFLMLAAPTQPPRRINMDKITEVIGGHHGSRICEFDTTIRATLDFDCCSPERITYFLKVMICLQVILRCYPLNKQTPAKVVRVKAGWTPTDRNASTWHLAAMMYEM